MKKTVIGLVLVFLLVGALTVSAEGSIFAAYNKPGQLNLYGSVGFYGIWGLEAAIGAEMIFGKFDVGPVPLEWGVMARGLIGLPFFLPGGAWIDWGAAPLVSLHTGLNFGKSLEFDVYLGLGLGLYGSTGTYHTWNAINFGFASFDGIAWKLSDKLFLLGEYGYVGSTSIAGVGVKMNL